MQISGEETFDLAPEAVLVVDSSPIHGLGVYARTDIPAGSRIVEYTGEIITKQESLERQAAQNEYIFYLTEEYDLDGNIDSNLARFINHSCSPNADAEKIAGRIWIVARRTIPAGEEITFNYGYDLTDYREHPCRCGSLECVGFMVAEEYLPSVRGNGPH